MNLVIPQQLFNNFLYLINGVIVPILFALAFLVFLWGTYRYFILHADNESERAKGKVVIFWSIIGFVAILSVWGLVGVVINTLGIAPGGAVAPPTL